MWVITSVLYEGVSEKGTLVGYIELEVCVVRFLSNDVPENSGCIFFYKEYASS